MTYDPNTQPPPLETERRRNANFGWILGAVLVALVVVGLFFVWPDRQTGVATTDGPATTGTTPPATQTAPTAPTGAPTTPAAPARPAEPAPAAPPPQTAPAPQ